MAKGIKLQTILQQITLHRDDLPITKMKHKKFSLTLDGLEIKAKNPTNSGITAIETDG